MNNTQFEKPTIKRSRIRGVIFLVGLVVMYYIFQLFNYQIVNGAIYRAQAEDNRTTEISDPTQRGII